MWWFEMDAFLFPSKYTKKNEELCVSHSRNKNYSVIELILLPPPYYHVKRPRRGRSGKEATE
jgi:hypothetical protein